MPDKTKDLRHAETEPDPNLNFTYNDLVEELKREYDYPERQAGDVTPRELADVSNLTERQWHTILNKKVKAGEMERFAVKEKGEVHSYFVYRKVKE